ncbi:helix-turn-helix domain-containing protein [Pseudoalteromonas sp. McH1-7]|nr:helix-turn-helix domain-containing protein [Pseudoalteromonas sp. McH1-7]
MVLAMKVKVGNHGKKLVLVKLADNACDQGGCWPSYQTIADQCEMSKRTVMRHIDGLCDAGLVSKEHRKGEKGNKSNYYRLNKQEMLAQLITKSGGDKMSLCKDKPQRGSDKMTPPAVTDDHQGSDTVSPPPSDTVSPRISQSSDPLNEPKKNKTKKGDLDYSSWPQMPTEQTLKDWLAMRKRMKANVSQTVINRLAKQFEIAVQNGVSVDDCLGECIVRNWRGFEFTWLANSGFQQRKPTNALQEIKQRCTVGMPLLDDNQRV